MLRVTALVLTLFALAGCSGLTVDLTPRIRPLEEEVVEGKGETKILLMDISGFITDAAPSGGLGLGPTPARVPMLVRIREELKKAAKDRRVKAVVLRINTPGGTVTASDIIYRELMLFREETRVPIIAALMDVAASGGYYIALAADRIVAHPTTVTGSIGTIMVTANVEGLLGKLGVATNTFKSAEHKDMGSPFRTLTPDERAIFQSVIDELQRQFVAKVVERRRLPEAAAKALADGRIYTAPQALDKRLVDALGYMPDALAAARSAIGVENAKIIVYKRPREYQATYYAQTRTEAQALDGTLERFATLAGPGPRFLYLWAP
ncbi:MAG TPA: signal peptide peptidase SppA [Methylomirabilota bacterium]|jgi:protease-4|nr:signal peptide peptidase SppA [Methylomirabilota bacterium]